MTPRRKKGAGQTELPLAAPRPPAKLGLEDTYRDYFLQYASYVITDRAIPDLADGFKPVQRRLMHSLWEMDDGRYHKVANIIGHTMQYHPHGDASIGAALVGMGQRGLLVDPQGNWGDPATGDAAAAPRYIEARLTKFAKEVLFAPHLTDYKLSYDGRRREPLTLPARFPILLLTGAEGIAVGLSTKILPHNFIEICEAVKSYLRQEPFELFPDFPTGGLLDVSAYNDGRPGSRVKVRAKLEKGDGKTIVIREIPFGATTASLIDSILAAADKGKIKLARIDDNTAAEVAVHVVFQRGVEMDKAIDALYAFTECELSHSPNGMVIVDGKPETMGAMEMVAVAADRTKALLKRDLEYQLSQLEQRWHNKSLVQIFVENRIYLRIEKSKTWESVLGEIDAGLEPFKKTLRREVTPDDLVMLTEVKMRRISAWDAQRARDELLAIDEEIKQVKKNLRNLVAFTIEWFDHLQKVYGPGRERRSVMESFDAIKAVEVVERTAKLYVDREGGFVGTDLKNAEELGACSTLDDVIVVVENGGMQVVRVAEKVYVGEKIIHAQLFAAEDRETVFNIIYEDALTGKAWVKRIQVGGVTREKIYNLGRHAQKPRILFCEPGAEKFVHIKLRKKPRIQTDRWFNFGGLLVKGRDAGGNVISKHRILTVKAISAEQYAKHAGEAETVAAEANGDEPNGDAEA
jgi:topoisomerase-4 subunit A